METITLSCPQVREYCEEMGVEIVSRRTGPIGSAGEKRIVIKAYNEGGCNCTEVDLFDLIACIREHLPELWNQLSKEK